MMADFYEIKVKKKKKIIVQYETAIDVQKQLLFTNGHSLCSDNIGLVNHELIGKITFIPNYTGNRKVPRRMNLLTVI